MFYLAIAYLLLIVFHYDSYRPLLKRFGHSTIFLLITMLGFTSQSKAIDWTAALAPCLLFFQTYVINAFYDVKEDKLNDRILLLEPVHLSVSYGFALQTLLWGFHHNTRLGLILLGLFFLTELYHNPRFRLKRFGLLQSLMEGTGAALCFAIGAGFSPKALIVGLAFGIASNLKDLDDHFGDHHAGNRTILVSLSIHFGTDIAVGLYKVLFLLGGLAAVSLAFTYHLEAANDLALLGLGAVTLSLSFGVFFGLHGERKMIVANGLILGLIPALSALL